MNRFKAEVAVRYGVKAAVIAQLIWDNAVYYKEDRHWFRCSVLMMSGMCPFLSEHMIKDAIGLLVQRRVIKKGCFNENKFDHTNWYAFTDFGIFLMSTDNDKEV